ncbi:hypothetical protein B0F90DRAFT_852600 [Multifurca ochricompacta]|uniref:Uncharacterized protein n=1 Tax=Multifurca ochricompacta TaxID=376703 RepID=A0AAD4QIM5_9AGAM|nr:hypothetical protein B0F90DRAFT_852600 [Multifurca ochricompacta]
MVTSYTSSWSCTTIFDLIAGTGEIIRGRAMDVADTGRGTGRDIAIEGRAEFERGLDKITEGKSTLAPTVESAPGDGGAGAGTGKESSPTSTSPRPVAAASCTATAAQYAKRSSETGHHADKGAAEATVGHTGDPQVRLERQPGEQTAPPVPPRDLPGGTNGTAATTGDQRKADAGQQGTGTPSSNRKSDRDEQGGVATDKPESLRDPNAAAETERHSGCPIPPPPLTSEQQ